MVLLVTEEHFYRKMSQKDIPNASVLTFQMSIQLFLRKKKYIMKISNYFNAF